MTLPFSSFFEPSHSRSLSASESKNVDSAWGWRVGGRHLNDERKIIIAGGWLRDASRRLSSKPLYAHVCASILSEMSAVFLFFFFVFLPLGRDSPSTYWESFRALNVLRISSRNSLRSWRTCESSRLSASHFSPIYFVRTRHRRLWPVMG